MLRPIRGSAEITALIALSRALLPGPYIPAGHMYIPILPSVSDLHYHYAATLWHTSWRCLELLSKIRARQASARTLYKSV